jgi:hypothetical protein
MTQELAKSHTNTELGETMAMALAEVGSFGQAVSVQRDVLEAARQGGAEADVRRMTANLRLYEAGRPSRALWPDDDPVYTTPLR